MALSGDQIDILADKYIIGLYQQMEDEVIADIARRVKKTGRYTETAELMAKSMVEQGYSAEKIQADVMRFMRADKQLQMEIAENTKAHKQEIQDIINATVKKAKEEGNKLVAEAGNMAWNNDLSMWQEQGVDLKKPNTMSQLISSFQAQTARELRNLTRSTGFRNTLLGTTGVMNAYQREMDLALLKVASGTFSYDVAVNECVHRLAQSGLRTIDYASGRTYQIDTAVRMSVRTGMSQLAGKIMEENLKSTGQDLVITSQHIGSRPEHVPWQNKVFSYSGKSKKYPDFVSGTGYGSAAGLKGVNCTHDFYPFFEGSSVIPDDIEEPAPVTVNGKEYTYYQATQKQRQMERSIRATKREIEAQKAIGGNTDDLLASLRRQRGEYYKFSADVNIRPKDNRLRVISGTSDLNKSNANDPYKRNRSGERVVRKHKQDIQSASTLEQINVVASDKFGIKVDFTKGSIEYAKEQLACYEKLANEYNQKSKVVQIDTNSMFGKSAAAESFISPDYKFATISLSGKNAKQSNIDRLHSYTVKVADKNVNISDLTHEFTHTITSSKSGDEEFWKEIKSIKNSYNRALTKIDKENIVEKTISYEEAVKRKSEIYISEYANKTVDEFMAEAFTDAKLSENPSQYSIKALEVIDKYFKKSSLDNAGKSSKIESEYKKMLDKRDIIKNSELKNGLSIKGSPNSISDKTDDDGKVLQRRVYGDDGKAVVDYDTTDHGLPHLHPTGAHKNVFDHSKKNPHGKPQALSEQELINNEDIIKRGENYHDD